jgi:predicted amidohydrolase
LPEIYGVTCVQSETYVVTGPADRDEVIQKNLDRAVELIDFVGGEARFQTRLVVFPEFFLTGVPESRTLEEYLLNAEPIPGPVTAPLQNAAAKAGLYVAANTFELDEQWPGRLWNTSFIIDDRGEIILKYRKHNDAFAPVNSHPGDVYSRYVDLYGEDALFPVVDTPLGRLACITCYDINFPEMARCFALKGAEVLIMPTGEGWAFVKKHSLMRQARAYENSCYVVSANHGRFYGGPRPTFQQGGHTEIVDYNGEVVAAIEGSGEATISGMIDLHGLRAKRARVDLFNFMACFRGELYAQQYLRHPAWPNDAERDRPIQDKAENFARGQQVLERLGFAPTEAPVR